MVPKEQGCSAMVWAGFHQHRCGNKGSIERDGKRFCKTHDPVRKAEKLEADRHKIDLNEILVQASWAYRKIERDMTKWLLDNDVVTDENVVTINALAKALRIAKESIDIIEKEMEEKHIPLSAFTKDRLRYIL